MKDYALEISLSLLGLLGGLNIFQFIFFRSTRRQYEAKADKAAAEAKHATVDLAQDQYDYVMTQLTRVQTDYNDLANKFRTEMMTHLEEIDRKTNEIVKLKEAVANLKSENAALRIENLELKARIDEL